MNCLEGDNLIVGDLILNGMVSGVYFLGIVVYEKCGIVFEVFEWIFENCMMCNECVFVCLYVVICLILIDEEEMEFVLEGFMIREMCGKDGFCYCI